MSTICCQVPSVRRPSTRGIDSDGPISDGPLVGVGVRVVVEAVVLVVALGRNEPVEQRLRSATPPGSYSIVVTAAVEPTANTVTTPRSHAGRPHHPGHPVGDVDHVAVTAGLEPEQSAVDGHPGVTPGRVNRHPGVVTRTRAKRRRPSCSTLPSTWATGRSSGRRTPGRRPAAPPPGPGFAAPRTSRRRTPAPAAPAGAPRRPPAPNSTSGMSSGSSCRTWTRSNCSSAACAAAGVVEALDQRPGQRALGVARAERRDRAPRPGAASTSHRSDESGMLSVLP